MADILIPRGKPENSDFCSNPDDIRLNPDGKTGSVCDELKPRIGAFRRITEWHTSFAYHQTGDFSAGNGNACGFQSPLLKKRSGPPRKNIA